MRVPQGRVRVRRDVGRASAPRRPARAPTRPPRARGCCSWPRRSTTPPGLGLPIVMTVANRAIGAPINIWNDHSRRDVAARLGLDPALRRVQPGGGRPAHPGLPARRGALAAGDGLHGRLHPHPRRRARSTCPTQEQVDAFLPPFEPRQVLDPDEPMTIGAMVGPEAFTEVRYLMHAKQMQALDADPGDRRRVRRARSGASSGGLRARATAPRTPRPSSSRSARCSARSRTSSTSCATQGVRDRRPRHQVLPAVAARRGARGARPARSASSSSRRRSRSASAGSSARTCGSRSRARRRTSTTSSPASAAGRSPSASLHAAVRRRARRTGSSRADLPRPRPRARRARARARRRPAPGPARREHAARPRHRRRGPTEERACQPIKFYQVGSVRGRQPAARPRAALGAGRRASARTRSPPGHRACQGCGEALGARYVARRRDARDATAS